MWLVDEAAIEEIAIGAGILGTGGGGNPYYGKLQVLRRLREGARIAVVAPEEVPDDALVVSVGGMGAPTVGIEKLERGDEPLVALRALEAHLGRRAGYLLPWEIGGGNSTRPLVQAAASGLPVIDADTMGRAFPELQMCTVAIYGVPCTPAALADAHHNTVVFPHVDSALRLERFARAVTVQMGARAGFAFPPMSGAEVRRTAIPYTLTLCRRIGRAVLAARARRTSRHDLEAPASPTRPAGEPRWQPAPSSTVRQLPGERADGAQRGNHDRPPGGYGSTAAGGRPATGDAAAGGTHQRGADRPPDPDEAITSGDDPVAAAAEAAGGRVLFRGKIVDLERRLAAGFARGRLEIDGAGPAAPASGYPGRLRIDFQNENLIARLDGATLAVVPDLICLVDDVTGEPATTEVVRYGLRVAVLGIPAPRLLKTPEALAVVGPVAFGYPDVAYQPLPGLYGGDRLADELAAAARPPLEP